MVFTYDDAQRSNSHKEKLFSLLVFIFFFSSYLQVGVTHGRLRDLGDTISHGLEPFEVRPESFVPPTLDGFEVPWLRWFVGEGLKVGGEASTEVAPVVDAVSG
jgi:hypothetical protein